MKQLKGKTKETAKEKRQRRKETAELKKQVYTIVMPALVLVAMFIAIYVFFKTRPVKDEFL